MTLPKFFATVAQNFYSVCIRFKVCARLIAREWKQISNSKRIGHARGSRVARAEELRVTFFPVSEIDRAASKKASENRVH